MKKYLIVNADDFGQSPGVNRGIIEAHERGIVTSASLMVRWPAAAEAACYGRAHPSLSLGLHVDLGEWACRNGTWVALYEATSLDDTAAVAGEIASQFAAFRHLVGKDPTHIDSHQHVHREEPVRCILSEIARELGVPLRDCNSEVCYCGSFYGQTAEGLPFPEGISVQALTRILAELAPGVTELGCHPGLDDDLETMYRGERAEEVKVLCDPKVRAAVAAEGITLRSFGELSRARRMAFREAG